MKCAVPLSVRRQRGLTLLEITVSLMIMGGVFMSLNTMIDRWTKDTVAATAGQQVRTLGDAAAAYIKDNYAAVMGVATDSTPALITVATLQGANYLSSGFAVANSYQQNQCVLVLEPVAGYLIGLVVAEGGTAIDDLTLGQIASVVGGSGGGIYSTATTTLQGTQNGWAQPVGNFANANHLTQKCDGTAGAITLAAGHPVMALWFTGGDSTSGFLYRNTVAGRPELNRMNTGLDMNNNAISNAATIALTTVVSTGDACATNGVIARDANGAVMSCQSGTYQPQSSAYWKDPVATFATLPVCNGTSAWQTRVVQTPTVGTGPRAYTCDGTSWQPLGVDNSGNITVGGTATLNNLAGNLTVTPVAVIGTACAPNGRIAQDGSGLILSCQSGVWRRDPAAGCSAGYTYTGGSCQAISTYAVGVPSGSSILRASLPCPAGYVYSGYYLVEPVWMAPFHVCQKS